MNLITRYTFEFVVFLNQTLQRFSLLNINTLLILIVHSNLFE